MRIASGTTDQYIYFVAVDATDFVTRETGLSSFTVYRSRDGGTAAAMTTPTINETDATNMPGVYELLLDEDTTVAAGNDTEEMALHITHAGMAPVTRTIELYRPKITVGNTLSVESDGDLTEVNTLTGQTVQTGDSFARLGAPAGASVSADIATVDTVADAIQAKTDSLTFTVAGNVDSNVQTIGDSATAGTNFKAAMDSVVPGTAITGTLTTTQMTTDLTETTDNHYFGRLITFKTGNLAGQQTDCTAYNGTTKVLSYTELTEAPANTDTFVIT